MFMRTVLVVIITVMLVTTVRAQGVIQPLLSNHFYNGVFARRAFMYDSSLQKKWSFQKYTGLSMGYSIFKGGGASFVAAPVGLQLNRKLNNNLYAFAGISAVPTYINFHSALQPDFMKAAANTGFMRNNTINMYSRAELGLMYMNDAKTFSISGSIGIERSSTPVFYSGGNVMSEKPVGALQ